MDHNAREKPLLKSGTKMVVRRPDGLGTAQLTSEKLPGAVVGSDVSPDSSLVTVRPHSTVQRAHSTVIPRGSKAKKIELASASSNGNGALHETKSKIERDMLSALGQFHGLESLIKSQTEALNGKQRVGVNPVLGNAGLMWESGSNKRNSVPQVTVSNDFCSLLNKRKSSTPDLSIPLAKKSKYEAFEDLKAESATPSADELGARRKELDNYTGCLPAHMLHLLPMTHKAALAGQSTGSIINSTSTESMSSELTALLQQYQALNAAAGLAANQEIGNGLLTSAGIDTSALLQLQLLQAFQRQTAELAALPAFSMAKEAVTPLSQNQPQTPKTPTTNLIQFPTSSPYKITPVKGGTSEKSKVKCLKTAEIPKIAQAELDSNVKLSSFNGITMTPSMTKRPSIPSELLQPFSKSTPSVASPPELWLKIIGRSTQASSKCLSMLQSANAKGEKVEVKISLSISGESETFTGICNAPKKKSNRVEVEVHEPVVPTPEALIPDVSNLLGQNLASLQVQARLLASSLGAASPATTVNPTNPFSISQILPKFNLDLPSIPPLNLTPMTQPPSHASKWKTPSPQQGRESSPEIIVDKLTPEDLPQKENATVTTTPTRNKGPKKNFLARQAALDAKMNVLRAKAESEQKSTENENGDVVKLEMSDSEMIEPHVDR
ncbi:Oidioi.mRNA.OKI2018_I69.chr2.g6326.t1.cds [Oikopleura dioica]|uniref:Oidioi.mRNA.OKI2018_I69.chr2.g6326.t1.cds n=1 Tax=Oikopleura dioica TaxID=34765 RepID=A0ABN7T2M7_OIKDI|nr:Oidioi.mRNA.OKI2018_I69.chr2.g6326.t1.cds [Oikopleura dioica]